MWCGGDGAGIVQVVPDGASTLGTQSLRIYLLLLIGLTVLQTPTLPCSL